LKKTKGRKTCGIRLLKNLQEFVRLHESGYLKTSKNLSGFMKEPGNNTLNRSGRKMAITTSKGEGI
jgi:hypothetical protein